MKRSLLYSLLIAAACGGQVKATETPFEKQYGNPEHLKKLTETGECTGCDLRGFDIAKAYETYLEYKRSLPGNAPSPINVSNSDLTGANLVNGWFCEGNFENAKLTDAQLKDGSFPEGNFGNANLAGAQLQDGSFGKCNFTKANLTNANLESAYLVGTDFSSSILINAILEKAQLLNRMEASAIFTNADITGANFKKVEEYLGRRRERRPLSRLEALEILAKAKNTDKAIFE